jgi:hypothetical protein
MLHCRSVPQHQERTLALLVSKRPRQAHGNLQNFPFSTEPQLGTTDPPVAATMSGSGQLALAYSLG